VRAPSLLPTFATCVDTHSVQACSDSRAAVSRARSAVRRPSRHSVTALGRALSGARKSWSKCVFMRATAQCSVQRAGTNSAGGSAEAWGLAPAALSSRAAVR